jgi:EAL domain-containing protein (putative c-di-GMP-specific phosphodiesterase class I)/GGDEF domain-containing protein
MTDARSDLHADRDRYVGFAFAAADLLLEIDAAGRIVSASGAAQSLLGRRQDQLIRLAALELFAPSDRVVVRRLLSSLDRYRRGGRLEPSPVMVAQPSGLELRALLGACRVPTQPGSTFVTLTALGRRDDDRADEFVQRDTETGLLQGDDLFGRAALASSGGATGSRSLLLLKVGGLSAATRALPEAQAKNLMEEVGGALRALSLGADSAGRLGEDEFGIVQGEAPLKPEEVAREISGLAQAAGVPEGVIDTKVRTVELSTGELGDEGAARAIAYAVRSFTETRGAQLTVQALEKGLPGAVDAAVQDFVALQRVIRDRSLTLVFQPIVALNNRQLHHYEALVRFPNQRSTFEAVRFAEAVGLSEELDLAVARLAIAEIKRTPGTAGVAVNVSGRSITGDRFRQELTALLRALTPAERQRTMFELTESAMVDRVDEAVSFLGELKRAGHAICLDDFGAGASAYAYLRHFDVDIVKVDGPFLRAAIERERERALIRSVCRLCRDLGCGVVGEMIEEERQADAAARLGIDYGQGWLFGKPMSELPGTRRPAAP